MRALDAGPMEELKERYPEWTDKLEDFPDGSLPELGISVKPNIIYKKKVKQV